MYYRLNLRQLEQLKIDVSSEEHYRQLQLQPSIKGKKNLLK
jgi:hypothetical protein